MIGPWEWVLIVVLVLLIFGAKKIPEIGRGLGQGIRSFKKEFSRDAEDDEKSDTNEKQDAQS